MFPTHAAKEVAALAAAALINTLIAKGVPYPRAAETGANLLLVGTGLLSPAEEEVLARDPMRAACYYCSPIRQQSAILIRHEVTASPPEGVEWWTDKQSEEVTEWCGDLEHNLSREADAWNLYGRSTFDAWPYVETTVEVDDDDLDGLDEDEIEKKFEAQLQEDESCNPTWVVLAPEGSTKVGPDPDYDDDDDDDDANEGEE